MVNTYLCPLKLCVRGYGTLTDSVFWGLLNSALTTNFSDGKLQENKSLPNFKAYSINLSVSRLNSIKASVTSLSWVFGGFLIEGLQCVPLLKHDPCPCLKVTFLLVAF